jgi:hypothetical protein
MAKFTRLHNIYSKIAEEEEIDNYPGIDSLTDPELTADFIWGNLEKLHTNCVIPILNNFGEENIRITSAYRSNELNEYVGGVSDSHHTKGYAVDLISLSHPSSMLWNWCYVNLEFNQLIWEFPERGDFTNADFDFSWIHISYIEGNNPKIGTMSSNINFYHEMVDEEQIEPVTRKGVYSHGITIADETLVGS